MKSRWRRLLPLVACLLCVAKTAAQTQIQVQGPSPALVQLGRSARLILQANFAQADLQFQMPEVSALRMQVGAPSRQTRISSFNGRTTRVESITQIIELTPLREGEFTIPQFEVRSGSVVRQVGPLTLECKAEPTGDEYASVRALSLPEKIFTAQPIRLGVEFEIDASLRLLRGRSSYDIWVDAPWLGESDEFVVIERAEDDDDIPMQINREIRKVPKEDVQRAGRKFYRFRYEVVVQPSAAGKLEFSRPILRFGVETGRARTGLFGERVGGQQERLISYGQETAIEVLPLPVEGRPADFGGAVGDFTVESEWTVDGLPVTEVESGRTLRRTFRIRSDGPLGFFRDPVLEDSEAFRVIGRRERREGDQLIIDFDLQPTRSGRQTLPGLDWVVFDTKSESYRALSGPPAEIDVRPAPEGSGLEDASGERTEAVIPGVDDIHEPLLLEELEGARWLSAEGEGWPESPSADTRWIVTLAPFAAGLLILLTRFGLRRMRRRAPVRGRGAKRAFYRAMHRGAHIDEALRCYLAAWIDAPSAATVGPDLADRLIDAGVDPEWAGRMADLLERSTAARYGAAAGPSFPEIEQAIAEFARAQRHTSGRSAGARTTAATAVCLLGLSMPALAQRAPDAPAAKTLAQTAESSYGAARYAESALLYEQALAAGAPKALYRNLGNAWYRSGEDAKAILAWERALLVFPGDSRLRENIDLAEARLDLADDDTRSLTQSWAVFVRFCGVRTLLWWTGGLGLLATFGLLLGRGALRAMAIVPALLALLGAIELLVLGPERPGRGVVLAERAEVRAEPQLSLDPLVTLRAGARVSVLSVGPDWVRVGVRERTGYVARAAIEPIDPRR